MDIVTVQNLKKYFGTGPLQVKAVDGIDLSIEKGKLTAVIGASGSGKTTLLNLIGGLYQPTEGTVTVDGVDLGTLREEELTVFHRRQGDGQHRDAVPYPAGGKAPPGQGFQHVFHGKFLLNLLLATAYQPNVTIAVQQCYSFVPFPRTIKPAPR